MSPEDSNLHDGAGSRKNERPSKLTTLAIIISVISLAFSFVSLYISYSPDFGVSIHPMQITMDQGGTTSATIRVQNNGIRFVKEYPWDVMLNSSLGTTGDPTRVSLEFTKVEDKPPYESILQVRVTPQVQPGVYPLQLKGIGNDGKEHTCTCMLKVTITPSIVNFTNPTNGGSVSQTVKVEGTTSGSIPEGRYLWLLVNKDGTSWWFPQSGRITPVNGQWSISTQFGKTNDDSGGKYHVAAVLVNSTDDQYYQNYMQTAAKSGNYPDITPVNSAQIVKAITVTKT